MKRRLQTLALCATALLAAHLLAQDTGGAGDTGGNGAGGAGTTDQGTPGGAGGTGGTGGTGDQNGTGGGTNGNGIPSGGNTNPSNGNGNPPGGTGNPYGAPGTPGAGGAGTTTPGGTGLPGFPNANPVSTPPSPPTTLPPGTIAPVPGATPSPSPSPSATPIGPNTTNPGGPGSKAAPVTFTLPGGYGGLAPQTLTLGQGRLAKPPITFTTSVSQGYDSNLFNAPSHLAPTPTPVPTPTPPLLERLVEYNIRPPYPPKPVFLFFRAKSLPTPTPGPTPEGIVGSPVTSVTLATQVQLGTVRTAVTADLSGAANQYWNRPGGKTDYSGSADIQLVHRLTPKATYSLYLNAVYQQTPNFALVNAPTNNGSGGSYLNGYLKTDITYGWSSRLSTVTSYALNLNLTQNNALQNVYVNTFGNQFRYTVSPRNTVTLDTRVAYGIYPSDASANNTDTFYLLGLDTIFSAKIHNTVSAGLEVYTPVTGKSQTLPYFESATTLSLPRGAGLSWTNNYGFQQPGATNPTAGNETVISYRTGLSYSQPFSTKVVGSVSVAYNNVATTAPASAGGPSTQNQFQASMSLGYTVSPRLSLSLSYTYLNLMNTIVNSSYDRDQIYLGGTYTFR